MFLCLSVGATSFTEFYVQTTGNNLNSGSTPDDAPTYTAAGGFWTNATGVWRKDGEVLSGVTNGAWASVYPDATTVNPVFIGLITNVTTTNIWISLTAKAGTSPVDDTAGATTIRVGGAWGGPNTNQNPSSPHPFNFVANTMTNTTGNVPRVNFKSGVYTTTNAITHANNGPIQFQGMTSTPGDLGKATIYGGTVYPSYTLLTMSAANIDCSDLIFSTNGATGSSAMINCSGAEVNFIRCVFNGGGRAGLLANATATMVYECEAYGNNRQNTVGIGGIQFAGSGSAIRSISRNNVGSNSSGFIIGSLATLIDCVSISNGESGFTITSVSGAYLRACVAYDNTSSGISVTAATACPVIIENCLIFKNGGSGVTSPGSSLRNGLLVNCAFGSGTQTNSSQNIAANLGGIVETGTITYTADQTPWKDPANGNFTLSTGATLVKAAGRGSFTQVTVNSPTNTVSYPDIGAAQSASTNSASSGGAYTWAQ